MSKVIQNVNINVDYDDEIMLTLRKSVLEVCDMYAVGPRLRNPLAEHLYYNTILNVQDFRLHTLSWFFTVEEASARQSWPQNIKGCKYLRYLVSLPSSEVVRVQIRIPPVQKNDSECYPFVNSEWFLPS